MHSAMTGRRGAFLAALQRAVVTDVLTQVEHTSTSAFADSALGWLFCETGFTIMALLRDPLRVPVPGCASSTLYVDVLSLILQHRCSEMETLSNAARPPSCPNLLGPPHAYWDALYLQYNHLGHKNHYEGQECMQVLVRGDSTRASASFHKAGHTCQF